MSEPRFMVLVQCCGVCGRPMDDAEAAAYGVGVRHVDCPDPREVRR